MTYIPPPRKRPRSRAPRMTRTIRHNGFIYLKGAKAPETLSRRQAETLKRSGAIE